MNGPPVHGLKTGAKAPVFLCLSRAVNRGLSVGCFPKENFLEGLALAAAVADRPAAGESVAREDAQHAVVVEVGVDAEGADAALKGQTGGMAEKFRPQSVPQRLVGHGQPVDDHIGPGGEPCAPNLGISGLAVEEDGSVGDDRLLLSVVIFRAVLSGAGLCKWMSGGLSSETKHISAGVRHVGGNVVESGVAVLPLLASGGGHAVPGLADDLQNAGYIAGCGASEACFFHDESIFCGGSVGRACQSPLSEGRADHPADGIFGGRTVPGAFRFRQRYEKFRGGAASAPVKKPVPGVPDGRTWRFVTSPPLTFCHFLTQNRAKCDNF